MERGNIQIHSRKSMEQLIARCFPSNTAVICFYEPEGTHIDYGDVTEDVVYIPLDDFQTNLPQADMIAEFVHKAMTRGYNVICQCEKGQNRSAGCAAAIMEYYYKNGQSLFDSDWYRPDEMVYYAVLQALNR